jgi:hypothetical protein
LKAAYTFDGQDGDPLNDWWEVLDSGVGGSPFISGGGATLKVNAGNPVAQMKFRTIFVGDLDFIVKMYAVSPLPAINNWRVNVIVREVSNPNTYAVLYYHGTGKVYRASYVRNGVTVQNWNPNVPQTNNKHIRFQRGIGGLASDQWRFMTGSFSNTCTVGSWSQHTIPGFMGSGDLEVIFQVNTFGTFTPTAEGKFDDFILCNDPDRICPASLSSSSISSSSSSLSSSSSSSSQSSSSSSSSFSDCPVSVNDDFPGVSGSQPNSNRWTVTNPIGTYLSGINSLVQRPILVYDATSGSSGQTNCVANYELCGDFEADADFDHLKVVDLDSCNFYFEFVVDGSTDYFYLSLNPQNIGGGPRMIWSVIRGGGVNLATHFGPIGLVGSVKLERKDGVIKVYVDDGGGWVIPVSASGASPVFTDTGKIHFRATTNAPNHPDSIVSWENFQVRGDCVSCASSSSSSSSFSISSSSSSSTSSA